jgi:hypothetical protein
MMSGASDDLIGAVVAVGGFVIHLLTVLRAITRPIRTPASRVAWIAAIMCLPVIGVVAYLFLGETSIGRKRTGRLRDAESRLATPSGAGAEPGNPVPLDQRLRPDSGQPHHSAWIAETGEDLYGLPAAAPEPEQHHEGVVAQMYGTGPTTPGNTMSDSFVSALYAAEHELIITTPYFVPDEALFRAVCAAPRRGVATTLIVPARNDSALVSAASRSAYPDLRWCQSGPRSANLASGSLRRCEMMTRMDRPTAHRARVPPSLRDRRRSRSPRNVSVRAAPAAAWVQ